MHTRKTGEEYFATQLKASVVHMIINGEVEEALERLANYYHVSLPAIKVGLIGRNRTKAVGCYAAENGTIYVLNSEALKNPYIILHEFYHHLRTSIDKKHRGTEKYANQFAQDFIQEYRMFTRTGRNE
jgi:hypothetical protein